MRKISRPGRACILTGIVVAAQLLHSWLNGPSALFFALHDSGIYFSSAGAIAEGDGQILPSLPGQPPQAKYPFLYPWLLSWVWRWQPSFPQNAGLAAATSALAGAWALAAYFWLLRRWPEMGDLPAFFCVTLTAFHGYFIILSGVVHADLPLMAAAATAAILGDLAMNTKTASSSRRLALAAALAAGVSLWLRSVGMAVVLGVLAAFWVRGYVRHAGVFLAGIVPFLAAQAGWAMHTAATPRMAEGAPFGWQQTWYYYTSYWRFWKVTVPDSAVFLNVIQSNLLDILIQPARLCLFPPVGNSPASLMLAVALSAGIIAGLVRHGARHGWRSIHFIVLFSVPAVLLWNFPITTRLMMPFLPLFYAGLWLEGRRLTAAIAKTFRTEGDPAAKTAAGAITLGLVLVIGLAAESYVSSYRNVYARNDEEASRTREHAEIEEWVRRNTAKDTVLLSTDDVRLFLTTGRRAVWPLAFSAQPAYHYDLAQVRREASHFLDAGRHTGARYWIVANHDVALLNRTDVFRETLPRLLEALPAVFRSSGGRYEVHDLACLQTPGNDGCNAAAPVLSNFYTDDPGS